MTDLSRYVHQDGINNYYVAEDIDREFALLNAKVEALKLELMRQWLAAHYDHCGHLDREHVPEALGKSSFQCHWPVPPVLRELGLDEVQRLLDVVKNEPDVRMNA